MSRAFEGLPAECDWVALREIVSAATAPVTLKEEPARDVIVATVLPGAVPALVRENGQILLGLQTRTSSGDASADLGHALNAAMATEPGNVVAVGPRAADSPRLQDIVAPDSTFDVTVHDTFDYWVDHGSEAASEVQASIEAANEAIIPAARLTSVPAAYWCRMDNRDQVRWVLPYAEEPLLNGLARLHAHDADGLGEGTRLLGTFRAHGLLVPVWDLAAGTTASDVEEPVSELAERLAAAVDDTAPLTAPERRARSGLANRQVTIRA